MGAPGSTVRTVLVLGQAGLARHIVVGALERRAITVLDPAAVGEEPLGDAVAVLVNPAPDHWAAAVALRVPQVLLLTDSITEAEILESVLRGADAVITVSSAADTLVEVIDTVARGGTLLSPELTRAVAETARGRKWFDAQPMESLTRRELEILQSIDRGETVKQTARLGISAKTVENLQSRLFRKLDVRNRAQAVSRAHALGVLE